MTNSFKPCSLAEAYKMLKPNTPALVSTKGVKDGLYDVTPYGWIMPMDYEPVTKVIFSSDPSHQAARNIKRTKEFAVCIPADENDPVIEKCGSISSEDADKFARFGLTGKKAEKIDVHVLPENSSGWIECRLVRVIPEGSVELFIGEAVAAFTKA